MALALVYIFATAKPFSIRRLAALFVLTLLMATPVLEVLRVRNTKNDALMIAAALTLLVWSTPLLRLLHDSIRRRSLTLDALRPVSEFVQLTYALGFGGLLTIAASVLLSGAKTLTLGHLMGFGPTTLVMALIARIALAAWPPRGRSRRPRLIRTAGYRGSSPISKAAP